MMGANIALASGPHSFQSTFEENTPLSYYKWTGNLHQLKSSELSPNLITNVSGAEYDLNFTGLTLTDRVNFQAISGSSISAPSTTTTGTVSSCTSSCVIPITSTTNLVVGMLVGDSTNNQLAVTAAITAIGSGQITVSCTNWVSAGTPCTTVNSTGLGSGDTLYFSPMLEINSSGTFIPMGTNSAGVINSSGLATPIHADATAEFNYIASLNRFAVQGGTSNNGLNTGCHLKCLSPWLMLPVRIRILITPCFAMGNTTDWVQKEITFAKNNLLPGLLPFLEGTDETWNPGYSCYYFSGL